MDTYEKKFLSRDEVAEVLHISLVTLARRLKDNSIPSTRVGHRVLIPAQFIDDLAAKALAGREAK